MGVRNGFASSLGITIRSRTGLAGAAARVPVLSARASARQLASGVKRASRACRAIQGPINSSRSWRRCVRQMNFSVVINVSGIESVRKDRVARAIGRIFDRACAQRVVVADKARAVGRQGCLQIQACARVCGLLRNDVCVDLESSARHARLDHARTGCSQRAQRERYCSGLFADRPSGSWSSCQWPRADSSFSTRDIKRSTFACSAAFFCASSCTAAIVTICAG